MLKSPKSLLALIASVGVISTGAAAVSAQGTYPDRPIKIIVGFSAGSSTDVAARLLAAELGDLLNQRVLVENRPGAASTIATQAVAAAEPDGYTLLMGTVANTIGEALKRDVNFEFPADFEPITLVGAVPLIMSVNASLEVSDIQEFIELATTRPEPLLYGSAGVGTAPHLSAELFASSVGAVMSHVPYQGSGDAVRDLAENRIDLVFAPQSSVVSLIEEGLVTGLASTLGTRSRMFPELPTVSEAAVEGFNTSVWFGLLAPANVPENVVTTLSSAVNEALQSGELGMGFANSGIEPLGGTPQDFADYIGQEITSWRDVVEQAGISIN